MLNKKPSVMEENNRISITFKRKDDHIPTAWEISNFIENFSSNYLKIGIIDQIADLLNQGVSPKDIFILDQSFDLHQKYKRLDGLKLWHKVMHLYPIGVPYGLMPSDNVFELRMIFTHFRRCNELLFKHRATRMRRNQIDFFAKLHFRQKVELERVLAIISESAIENVKKAAKIPAGEKEKFAKEYQIVLDESRSKIKEFNTDSVVFESLEEMLGSKKTKLSKLSGLQRNVMDKYYGKFYHYLSKVSRPLVCYIDRETKNIEILGIGNINTNKRDLTFIDIKSVSHSSPLIKELITGMTSGIATVFETVNDEQRKREIHQKKLEQEDRQIRLLEIEEEIAEQRLAQEKLKTANEMVDFINKNNIDVIKNIDNLYLKSSLDGARKECQSRSKKVIYSNNLEITNMKVIESKFDKKI